MIKLIRDLAIARRVGWKRHALKRMLECSILRQNVFEALLLGEIIERHHTERPLPSFLILAYHDKQALHVVCGVDETEMLLWIITVYRPSADEWLADFKTRRKI